ncbi:MAG: hypothetical protein ACRDL6_11605, partial [Solirubrobacterales bacterium]
MLGRRHHLLSLAAALLLATTVSAAQAQETTVPEAPVPEDPCLDVNDEAGQDVCDTEYTPVAKDATTVGFELMGGASFESGNGSLAEGSPTPYTVDFFTNAFPPGVPEHGFFAGAQCVDHQSTEFGVVEECERAPAIYEYAEPPGQDPTFNQVRGPEASGEAEPGYVAEIAWIGPDRAIAVGGSGEYPRRELPRASPTETDAEYAARDLAGEEPNAAGRARVWLYSNERWRELDEEELPETAAGEPMAGLTTVDCSTSVADGEFCIAGGMRQLWHWRSGAFTQTESFTPANVPGGWRFRVRAVRFRAVRFAEPTKPIAVTSGCCAESEARNAPRLLILDRFGRRWEARHLVGKNFVESSLAESGVADVRQSLPDSYYALDQDASSLIATPGGPESGESAIPEPASRVIRILLAGGLLDDAVNPRLSSVRLLSGDGDFDRSASNLANLTGASPAPSGDQVMDWAAGVLRSSGQGILYTTTKSGTLLVNPTDCAPANPDETLDCKPGDAEQTRQQTVSSSLYELDTYALNSFAFVPGGSRAWAAGDKGALACLGCSGGINSDTEEPAPPRLGAPQPGAAPASAPYDGLRPPASDGETGDVPA